jgi:4-hydroxybenzoate polyprenyltransferase
MTRGGALAAILTDIKLGHSIFALPFAAVGLLIGTRGKTPGALLVLEVLAAMVLARSAAMGWNRLADHAFDASNPRTRGRALPAGRVSRGAMTAFVLVCSAGFVAVAGMLNPLCLVLSPLVLAVLLGYSLAKRITPLAHLLLGLALALAPAAAYLAARGSIDADASLVLWLGAGVLCWVAGFDVIYACQDIEHDRREGLHSIPARLGARRALWIARGLHALMLVALAITATIAGWGPLSWTAIGLVGLVLVREHGLVSAENLSRVNAAFFTANGIAGLIFATLVGTDLLSR